MTHELQARETWQGGSGPHQRPREPGGWRCELQPSLKAQEPGALMSQGRGREKSQLEQEESKLPLVCLLVLGPSQTACGVGTCFPQCSDSDANLF